MIFVIVLKYMRLGTFGVHLGSLCLVVEPTDIE